MKEKIVIAFVPVLHAGYLKFFERHRGSKLYLLSQSLYRELEQLTREIRALRPQVMCEAIRGLQIFSEVGILTSDSINDIDPQLKIFMPSEDISLLIAEKYLGEHFVTFESIFLRYDMDKIFTKHPVIADRQIDLSLLGVEFMDLAKEIAQKSPDWWRQVGCVLVSNGRVLDIAYNRHMPAEQSLYALGDPRNNFQPGEHLQITSAHHAEKVVIARAAKNGTSTNGAVLFVSTFPCPACAYDIAAAGIKKVYYSDGYSSLAAEETLKLAGIEIIRVSK